MAPAGKWQQPRPQGLWSEHGHRSSHGTHTITLAAGHRTCAHTPEGALGFEPRSLTSLHWPHHSAQVQVRARPDQRAAVHRRAERTDQLSPYRLPPPSPQQPRPWPCQATNPSWFQNLCPALFTLKAGLAQQRHGLNATHERRPSWDPTPPGLALPGSERPGAGGRMAAGVRRSRRSRPSRTGRGSRSPGTCSAQAGRRVSGRPAPSSCCSANAALTLPHRSPSASPTT